MWLGCLTAVALSAVIAYLIPRLVSNDSELGGCSSIVAGALAFVFTRPDFSHVIVHIGKSDWTAAWSSTMWFDPAAGAVIGVVLGLLVSGLALFFFGVHKRIPQ